MTNLETPTSIPSPKATPVETIDSCFHYFKENSLKYKQHSLEKIVKLTQILTTKKDSFCGSRMNHTLNTSKLKSLLIPENYSSATKIIIPLSNSLVNNNPGPLFKVENKAYLGKKRSLKSTKKSKTDTSVEDCDVPQETVAEPPKAAQNQSNYYNVNITNVNINYNGSNDKKILKEIKALLSEKECIYYSSHQKDSKDLKFSYGDYAYLLRQNKGTGDFICLTQTFNGCDRSKDSVATDEKAIMMQLHALSEMLKK